MHNAVSHLLGKQSTNSVISPATTPTGPVLPASASMPINVKSNGPQNGNNGGVIISPRYKEFKTYSSTFDGLQALEQSQAAAAAGGGMVAVSVASVGTANLCSNATAATARDIEEQITGRNLQGIGAGKRELARVTFGSQNNKPLQF